jgi:peptide/nickel transport system substrate-binding protein
LTYTFKIRDGAQWSDGKPITSADMKFTIDAIMSDKVESALKQNTALIKEVKVVDDQTYQIILKQVNCAAMTDFGQFPFMPSYRFKPDFSDLKDNPLNTKPDVSGGPYILKEWKSDEFVSFTANPSFWKGAPKIPNLVIRIIPDPTIMIQSFEANQLDYGNLQGDLFEQISNKDNLNYVAYPQVTVTFMSMNWADPTDPQSAYDKDGKPNPNQKPHPIFSDVKVRQAVAMGYNKDDVLSTLGDNGGTRLVGVVAPTVKWAYNSDVQPYAFDPKAAAQLLDEAGWKLNSTTGIREKNGNPLKFTISYSDIIKSFETTALVAQDQLKQLGMDVTLKKLPDFPTYLNEVYYGQKYDLTPMSNSHAGGPPDPDEFTTLLDSHGDVPGGGGNNLASYVNPTVDDLIVKAKSAPGCKPADRAPFYQQIQKIVHDDVGYEFTFTPNLYQITNKRVGNFTVGATWGYYGYTDHVSEWTLRQ